MRHVVKKLDDKSTPAILTNQETLDALESLSLATDPSKIRANYYRDPYPVFDATGVKTIESRVRDQLNLIYFRKCAYCETLCEAQIEHYRPKAGVSGEVGHPGYYWLCYEWSNLIPSCYDCNRNGAKGNQFPIQGNRLVAPTLLPSGKLDKTASRANGTILRSELPYLLYPEIDDPIDFLGVAIDAKGEGICLTGLDGHNQRGEQTINVCRLNRTDLKLKRLIALKNLVNSVNHLFKLLELETLKSERFEKALTVVFKQADDHLSDLKLA